MVYKGDIVLMISPATGPETDHDDGKGKIMRERHWTPNLRCLCEAGLINPVMTYADYEKYKDFKCP